MKRAEDSNSQDQQQQVVAASGGAYPDWAAAAALQAAYYGQAGQPPPGYYPAAAAVAAAAASGSQPHPYMWAGQMMSPYGTPGAPYAPPHMAYPHSAMYAGAATPYMYSMSPMHGSMDGTQAMAGAGQDKGVGGGQVGMQGMGVDVSKQTGEAAKMGVHGNGVFSSGGGEDDGDEDDEEDEEAGENMVHSMGQSLDKGAGSADDIGGGALAQTPAQHSLASSLAPAPLDYWGNMQSQAQQAAQQQQQVGQGQAPALPMPLGTQQQQQPPPHHQAGSAQPVPGAGGQLGHPAAVAAPGMMGAVGAGLVAANRMKKRAMGMPGDALGLSTDMWMHQDERELKRQRRKQSNRESARRSRLRKQAECEELTSRVQLLTEENAALKAELQRLQEACQTLAQHNAQLEERLNDRRNGKHTTGAAAGPSSDAAEHDMFRQIPHPIPPLLQQQQQQQQQHEQQQQQQQQLLLLQETAPSVPGVEEHRAMLQGVEGVCVDDDEDDDNDNDNDGQPEQGLHTSPQDQQQEEEVGGEEHQQQQGAEGPLGQEPQELPVDDHKLAAEAFGRTLHATEHASAGEERDYGLRAREDMQALPQGDVAERLEGESRRGEEAGEGEEEVGGEGELREVSLQPAGEEEAGAGILSGARPFLTGVRAGDCGGLDGFSLGVAHSEEAAGARDEDTDLHDAATMGGAVLEAHRGHEGQDGFQAQEQDAFDMAEQAESGEGTPGEPTGSAQASDGEVADVGVDPGGVVEGEGQLGEEGEEERSISAAGGVVDLALAAAGLRQTEAPAGASSLADGGTGDVSGGEMPSAAYGSAAGSGLGEAVYERNLAAARESELASEYGVGSPVVGE